MTTRLYYSGSDPFADILHDDCIEYQLMGQTRCVAGMAQHCRGKGQTRADVWSDPNPVNHFQDSHGLFLPKSDSYLEGTACLSEDGAIAQDRHHQMNSANNRLRFEQAPARRIGKWGSSS